MDKARIYGIITGDVVGSGKIIPEIRTALFDDMALFLKSLAPQWISAYETYRGDSLQCIANSPVTALRIALMIRSFFRAYLPERDRVEQDEEKPSRGYFTTDYDIRLGVGLGGVDFIGDQKVTSSDGEAFRLSGEALDRLMSSGYRLSVNTPEESLNEQLEPAVLLADALVQKWTQNQAEVVLHKLQDKKEEDIAGLLNISQSAVNQRAKTAQWHALEKLVLHFEKIMQSRVE